MITVNKWYPMVQPNFHYVQGVAMDKAIAKVQDDYRQAVKVHKLDLATKAVDLELYNKRAQQNKIELAMFSNRKRFDSFT